MISLFYVSWLSSDEPIRGEANTTSYYDHIVVYLHVYLHLVMGSSEKHCLRWNELKENITSSFKKFTDVPIFGMMANLMNPWMWSCGQLGPLGLSQLVITPFKVYFSCNSTTVLCFLLLGILDKIFGTKFGSFCTIQKKVEHNWFTFGHFLQTLISFIWLFAP